MLRHPFFFVFLFLIGLHAFTLLLYALDKRRAQLGRRRIPEAVLLGWTLFGGGGALVGIFRLRHKNRKTAFLLLALPAVALCFLWQLWFLRRIF